MLKRGISCETLQIILQEHGYVYTLPSITSKICRGSFSADFMIQCYIAMGCKNINIEQISNEATDK